MQTYLDQLEGLTSFFLSCDEQTNKVISITSRLQNALTKLILQLLAFILATFHDSLQQKISESTTGELYEEISQLVKFFAKKYVEDISYTCCWLQSHSTKF